MQKVRMLSSQMGVPDGQLHPVPFVEGEVYEVGPDLLQGFINLGAVELADTEVQPRELAEGEMLEEGELPDGSTAHPADDRETKVTGPEETKPANKKKR